MMYPKSQCNLARQAKIAEYMKKSECSRDIVKKREIYCLWGISYQVFNNTRASTWAINIFGGIVVAFANFMCY